MIPSEKEAGNADPAAQLRRLSRRWRRTVGAVFLVVAAAVWLIFFESMAHERRLTLAAVADRDANLARAVEHYAVRVLRTAQAVQNLLGGMVAQGRSDEELLQMLSDRMRANDVFGELGLCLQDGRLLPRPESAALLTAQLCERAVIATPPGPVVSVLTPIGPAGALRLPLALQIRDADARLLGVSISLVAVETILGIMPSVHLKDDTVVVLAGADGQARAAWRSRTGHAPDAVSFDALAPLIRSPSGVASIEGREYLASSQPVPALRLRVVVASARDDALATYRDRRARMFLLCTLMTAGLAGAYWLLARMHAEGVERTDALGRARADLQALNAGLDRQVQERTAQLEQANRDLETFSYAVAHDVRAPLAGVSGFADALQPLVDAAGSDKQQHYLRRIKANAAHMDELTLGLLELGRLSRAPLVQVPVDLTALAHEVVTGLRESGAGREVEVHIEPGLSAHGDRALLRQVLENLLGNAWKFSSRRPNARIAFGRERAGGPEVQAVFCVKDNGEGFDNALASRLFQPFSRLHKGSEFPGTGLGLATVRRIVVLHGGEVWCSARPGAGACFFFSLPAQDL
jgi:signal transduction histidine kinase